MDSTTNTDSKRDDRILLSEGSTADKDFYKAIEAQVESVIPELTHGKRYTLKKLCGEFWDVLERGEKNLAGKCMAHMVATKKFPIHFVKTKHEYPLHYQLN